MAKSDPDTRAEALNPVAHIDYVLTGWLISHGERRHDAGYGFEDLFK